MHPSNLDCFSATQHGNKDLFFIHSCTNERSKCSKKSEKEKRIYKVSSEILSVTVAKKTGIFTVSTYQVVHDFARNGDRNCDSRSYKIVHQTKCSNTNQPNQYKFSFMCEINFIILQVNLPDNYL